MRDITLTMDGQPVRFTRDGRISLADAIRAVSGVRDPQAFLTDLQGRHPKAFKKCTKHQFREKGPSLVADSDSWENIFTLIFQELERGEEPPQWAKE
jgi:hypothetical protein